MTTGNTFSQIASTTLSSTAASVTFSSIAGTYTDLVLVIVGANAGGSRVRYQFNSDTGSNYSRTNLVGTGSSAASYSGSNNTVADLNVIGGATALTAPYTIITNFQNYSNTTTYKTLITRFGSNDSAAPAVETIVNLWRSTSAINRIDIIPLGGNFVVGSTFNLYGITAA